MCTPEPKPMLLTGGSGFLGQVIRESLEKKQFSVTSLGRSSANDIPCDLSTTVPFLERPFSVIIHNAGKAHSVPKNSKQAKEFIDNNSVATRNLLTGIDLSGYIPKAIVFISSIAVYGLVEGYDITECQDLRAEDPYGRSKIEAEKMIESWAKKHSISAAILRLPLVAGVDAPGNLGSMIKAIRNGWYFRISGGKARKSVVLARDVADIIPKAAEFGGTYHLTDGYHPSFAEIEDLIVKQTESRKPLNLPFPLAKALGVCGDFFDFIVPGTVPITSEKIRKIVLTLTFNDEKARKNLGWKPRRVIDEFIV